MNPIVIDASPPLRSFPQHASSPIVKVTVGSGLLENEYNLHKTLLIEQSEYFRSCFNVNLLESRSNHVALPEDNPKAFNCFLNWAYTGRASSNMSIEDCINAYILADKLLCPRQFRLDIVTHFYSAAERRQITLKHVETIVDSGLTESDLMDAAIVELANAVKGDWPTFEKDEAWRRILAADAGLTLRVLAALRTSWTQVPGGRGARTGTSKDASGNGRERKRKNTTAWTVDGVSVLPP